MTRNTTTRTTGPAMTAGEILARAINEARQAMPFHERVPAGFTEPTHRIPKPAVSGCSIDLRALIRRPVPSGRDGRAVGLAEIIRPAGESTTIAAALLGTSRAAMAGAHIITETPARPVDTGRADAPGLALVPSGLRLVTPAGFSVVPEDAPVAETPLGDVVKEAKILRPDDLTQYGFRVALPRSAMRDVEDERLQAEVLAGIVLGLGRAVDMELLGAMLAANPPAVPGAYFTLAAAAAKGVRFPELRAFAGTAAEPVADRGELFLNGVPADFTDVIDRGLVAAFDRFGVVIADRLEVLAQRTSADGSVVLTCWAGIKAVMPDPGFAWSV